MRYSLKPKCNPSFFLNLPLYEMSAGAIHRHFLEDYLTNCYKALSQATPSYLSLFKSFVQVQSYPNSLRYSSASLLHCFLFSPVANMQGSDRHSSLLSTSLSCPHRTQTSFSGDCSPEQFSSTQLVSSSVVSMSPTSLNTSVQIFSFAKVSHKPPVYIVSLISTVIWQKM